jgi:FtsZ-binding cell division protein ZapB
MNLSAKKAAEQVGITKQAVINAIRKGKISAEKDHNGEWKIDPAELFRVYQPVNQLDGKQDTKIDDALSSTSKGLLGEVSTLRERLRSLEGEREREREQLTGQIDDLRRRLDQSEEERRKTQSQLTALLTDQRPVEPRSSFWRRLTGRK